jgi:hypothetical protein
MAARVSYINTRNFPVLTVKAYEGTLTRYTTGFNEVGGQQDVAVYSAPMVKGALVQLKDHTTLDVIQVERVAAGDNVAHGITVSSPQGVDNATTTGGTPTYVYQRKVDVAFFAMGVIELTVSATETICPGDVVGIDADEQDEVEILTDYAAVAQTDDGGFVALTYATVGLKVSLLVGNHFWLGN